MDYSEPITPRRWHHRPNHLFEPNCTYIVTASTLHSQRLFNTPARLSFLEAALLTETKIQGWDVEAWVVFPNHYHAEEYPYGCARWFAENADAVFIRRVKPYGWERVKVYDPF